MDCPFVVPEGATCTHRDRARMGDQFLFDFANKWGASVVRGPYTYGGDRGLWELAVLWPDGSLNYEHPVSEGDVRGHLEVDAVSALLAEIAATKKADEVQVAKSEGRS